MSKFDRPPNLPAPKQPGPELEDRLRTMQEMMRVDGELKKILDEYDVREATHKTAWASYTDRLSVLFSGKIESAKDLEVTVESSTLGIDLLHKRRGDVQTTLDQLHKLRSDNTTIVDHFADLGRRIDLAIQQMTQQLEDIKISLNKLETSKKDAEIQLDAWQCSYDVEKIFKECSDATAKLHIEYNALVVELKKLLAKFDVTALAKNFEREQELVLQLEQVVFALLAQYKDSISILETLRTTHADAVSKSQGLSKQVDSAIAGLSRMHDSYERAIPSINNMKRGIQERLDRHNTYCYNILHDVLARSRDMTAVRRAADEMIMQGLITEEAAKHLLLIIENQGAPEQ